MSWNRTNKDIKKDKIKGNVNIIKWNERKEIKFESMIFPTEEGEDYCKNKTSILGISNADVGRKV